MQRYLRFAHPSGGPPACTESRTPKGTRLFCRRPSPPSHRVDPRSYEENDCQFQLSVMLWVALGSLLQDGNILGGGGGRKKKKKIGQFHISEDTDTSNKCIFQTLYFVFSNKLASILPSFYISYLSPLLPTHSMCITLISCPCQLPTSYMHDLQLWEIGYFLPGDKHNS